MTLSLGSRGESRRADLAEEKATLRRRPNTPTWSRRYSHDLVLFDSVASAVAIVISYTSRFGFDDSALRVWATAIPFGLVTVALITVWLGVMWMSGSYATDTVGSGSLEYERVVNGGIRFLALIATASFAFKIDVARGFVAVLLPAVILLTVTGRWAARGWLDRQRAQGECSRRVVVTGNPSSAHRLVQHLERSPLAGYRVVGVCLDDPSAIVAQGRSIPVLGRSDQVLSVLDGVDANVVAIAGELGGDEPSVQHLSRELMGSGIELLVAPALTEVAGPRVTVRPVAGLPLVKVAEPQFAGPHRLVKGIVDRTAGIFLFVSALPILAFVALAVKSTSRGPALFRQDRVGLGGSTFSMLKFRTMVVGAEKELGHLLSFNEHDGPLFKMRDDPRRTWVGKFLRRFSIDELPQLWHVARGEMSLVGPRPPLPSEVAQYDPRVARRLLVKPGLTGLWQVSGRADLSWHESVRLDLYYVENWSLALDAAIIGKTISAVVRGRGAY